MRAPYFPKHQAIYFSLKLSFFCRRSERQTTTSQDNLVLSELTCLCCFIIPTSGHIIWSLVTWMTVYAACSQQYSSEVRTKSLQLRFRSSFCCSSAVFDQKKTPIKAWKLHLHHIKKQHLKVIMSETMSDTSYRLKHIVEVYCRWLHVNTDSTNRCALASYNPLKLIFPSFGKQPPLCVNVSLMQELFPVNFIHQTIKNAEKKSIKV